MPPPMQAWFAQRRARPLPLPYAAKGDWDSVFLVGVIANVIVALMAVLVPRPLRKAHQARNIEMASCTPGM